MPDVEATFRPRLPGAGPFLPIPPQNVPLSEALFVDPGTLVPAEAQDGTAGAPFSAIQTAVDALASKAQGTIFLAPGAYNNETVNCGILTDLTFMGLGSVEHGCEMVAVDINASQPIALSNINEIGTIAATGRVLLQNVRTSQPITALDLVLINSQVGHFVVDNGVVAHDSRCLDGGSATGVEAYDSSFETLGIETWFFPSGSFQNCSVLGDGLFGNVTVRDCEIVGAWTGSDLRAFNTLVGGGTYTYSVQIIVDQVTYQRIPPASWISAAVFVQGAAWSPGLRQIGYSAGVPSQTFNVLVANQHPPGLYLIYAPFVVRTIAGAGTLTRTITWQAPTLGAQTHTLTGGIMTILGTKFQDVVAIVSNGLANVAVNFSPVGTSGVPAIDIYAASLQGGANLF